MYKGENTISFKITKDISPEKISGYTFQGLPIVIGKRRGRPPRTRAKPTWYPVEKKVHAACLYAVTGDLDQVAKLSDIPKNQLKTMMGEQWWIDTIAQVRVEENDQISAKMTTVIDKSLDAVIDRVENGDHALNLKTGEMFRVPVKLRDLALPISILTDKRQLLRGEATSRTERLGQDDILKELGSKFEAFAQKLGQKKPDVIDVTPVEIVEDAQKTQL